MQILCYNRACMAYIVYGLGNPGEEYEGTRHSVGHMALAALARQFDGEWKGDKKTNADISKVEVGEEKVALLRSYHFMNQSGGSVKPLIGSIKAAEKLIVIHDDLDLPLGTIKISFNRGSGGNRGVESIIKALKTEAFVRIRIGISKATAKGVAKKPVGEEKVIKHILGKFSPDEMVILKKVFKKVGEAVEMIVGEGRERAMGKFNKG